MLPKLSYCSDFYLLYRMIYTLPKNVSQSSLRQLHILNQKLVYRIGTIICVCTLITDIC